MVLGIWKWIFWKDVQQNENKECSGCDCYLRGEAGVGKNDALDLCRLFPVPLAHSVAKIMQRAGHSCIPCVRKSCCFLRHHFSGVLKTSFGSLSLWNWELPSSWFLQVRVCWLLAAGVNTLLPLPSDTLTAFCNYELLAVCRIMQCLQPAIIHESTFPIGEAELCSSRRHQFHCRNRRPDPLNQHFQHFITTHRLGSSVLMVLGDLCLY